MDIEEFDRQLKARGWRYDVSNEEFREGERRLEWEDVIGLVPGTMLDEPACYQDDKDNALCTPHALEHSR